MMRSILVLAAAGVLALCATAVQAQDAILGQMYGSGVHAYFSGEYVRAHGLLTKAIDAGSRDPRCYYFRGLTYLNLGRPQDAESDFQQGAKLETADLNKTYSVAKSLERVQGPARLDLEQYRAAARMAALEQSEKLRKQRYEELNREERRALESQVGPPPANAGAEAPPPPEVKSQDNPFAVPNAAGAEKPAEKPAEPGTVKKPAAAKPAEVENPFDAGGAKKAGKADKAPADAAKPAEEEAEPAAPEAPEKAPAKAAKGAAKKDAGKQEKSADPFDN
jgi:tetratricopeptide (TPR) repeat protein